MDTQLDVDRTAVVEDAGGTAELPAPKHRPRRLSVRVPGWYDRFARRPDAARISWVVVVGCGVVSAVALSTLVPASGGVPALRVVPSSSSGSVPGAGYTPVVVPSVPGVPAVRRSAPRTAPNSGGPSPNTGAATEPRETPAETPSTGAPVPVPAPVAPGPPPSTPPPDDTGEPAGPPTSGPPPDDTDPPGGTPTPGTPTTEGAWE